MSSIGELPEPFIWMVISSAIPSTMNRQKNIEIACMTTENKLTNEDGSLENAVKFSRQPIELFDNMR